VRFIIARSGVQASLALRSQKARLIIQAGFFCVYFIFARMTTGQVLAWGY
jgi:hypothetical protein